MTVALAALLVGLSTGAAVTRAVTVHGLAALEAEQARTDGIDIGALEHQLAVVTADKARWRRDATDAWRTARNATGLLANRRRPIPLGPAHTAMPDYGRWTR